MNALKITCSFFPRLSSEYPYSSLINTILHYRTRTTKMQFAFCFGFFFTFALSLKYMECNATDEMQSYYFLLGKKIILPLSMRELFLGIMLVFSDTILFLVISFAEVNILVSINSELIKHSGDFYRFFFSLTQRHCVY